MSRTDGGPGAGEARPPLAILAGAGAFPLEVAGEARRAGRDPFLVGVVGATDSAIEAYPHVWVRMGEVGKLFAALKERAIAEMVIIGAMTRPELADLRLDWGAVRRAAGLAQLFRRGDNGLLAGLAAIIEREGVRVVGAHEIAPASWRRSAPSARARRPKRTRQTLRLARRSSERCRPSTRGRAPLSPLAGCWRSRQPKAPTPCLPASRRCAPTAGCALPAWPGVLVKAPKRGQDLRLDMPAVGPKTIEGAVKAQLRGVAIAAGRVLVLERALCARRADAAGLFVAGFAYPPPAG